jgi:hypothetical protein
MRWTRHEGPDLQAVRVAAEVRRGDCLLNWTTVVAAYAAGVSTIVGGQQIIRELPSVRVRALRTGKIFYRGETSHVALTVHVSNAGRRPIVIAEIFYVSSTTEIGGIRALER